MISKKAAAFFGTPPGEGGGGSGKGERRGGGSPGLHAPGAKRNGGSLGIPLRSGAERRTLAAAGGSAPSSPSPEGMMVSGYLEGFPWRGNISRRAISPAIAASLATSRVSHSQIIKTRHPATSSARVFRISRAAFPSSFGCQNSKRLLGSLASLQSGAGCRCQKHPCMKTATLRAGKIKSGRPGRALECSR